MFVRSVDLIWRLVKAGMLLAVFLIALLQLIWLWLSADPDHVVDWARMLSRDRLQIETLTVDGAWYRPRLTLSKVSWRHPQASFFADRVQADLDLLNFSLRERFWGPRLTAEGVRLRWKPSDADPDQALASLFRTLDALRQPPELWLPFRQVSFKRVTLEYGRWRLSAPLIWLQGGGMTLTAQGQIQTAYEKTVLWRHRVNGYLQLDYRHRLRKGRIGWRTEAPAPLSKLARLLQTRWRSGAFWLDGQLQWQDGRPVLSLQADMRRLNLTYLRDKIDSVGVTLRWRPGFRHQAFEITRWRINRYYLDNLSKAVLRWRHANEVDVDIRQWHIDPFKPVLKALWPRWRWEKTRLSLAQLRGQVQIRPFRIVSLSGRIDRLEWAATRDYPGVLLNDARLLVRDGQLRLVFPQPIRLRWPSIDSRTWQVALRKPVQWDDRGEKGWRIVSPAMQVNGLPASFSMESDAHRGRLDFVLQPKTIARLKTLLPDRALSPSLRQRLEGILQRGRLEPVRLHAAWRTESVGETFQWHVSTYVRKGEALFDARWPALTDVETSIRMTSDRIALDVEHAQMAGVTLQGGKVEVLHLDRPDQAGLRAYGHVQARADGVREFILKTPLAERLGASEPLSNRIRFPKGTVDARLSLWAPLYDRESRSVNVDIQATLEKVRIDLDGETLLSGLQGKVHVTQQSAISGRLTGMLKGMPTVWRIETKFKPYRFLRLQGRGRGDLTRMLADVRGDLAWRGRVDIPLAASRPVRFSLKAETEKIRDNALPAPLDEWIVQPVSIDGRYDRGRLSVRGSWGRAWLGALWKRGTGRHADLRLRQLTFLVNERFSIASRLLSRDEENILISGRLAQLPLHAWAGWWPRQKAVMGIRGSATAKLPLPLVLGVRSASVGYHAQRFENAALTAYSIDRDRIGLKLRARHVDAEALWFPEQRNLVILANRLRLKHVAAASPDGDTAAKACRPWQRPAEMNISFTGRNVQFDRYRFDRVVFKAYADPAQSRLENIVLEAAGGKVKGRGQMVWDFAENRTRFDFRIQATPVEVLLQWAGFAESGFLGEKAQVQGKVQWHGPPDCFDLAQLQGDLDIRFDDGVIRQARLGMAKLIGLISVDSLLRNLKLTLSQLRYEGMVYDYIDARLQLHPGGKADLKRFRIDAPVMYGELGGKVDYLLKTYDLTASVYPKVGGALATVATLLGWTNPLTAITTYLVVKGITGDKAMQPLRYRIVGDWLSPTIVNLDTGAVLLRPGEMSVAEEPAFRAEDPLEDLLE